MKKQFLCLKGGNLIILFLLALYCWGCSHSTVKDTEVKKNIKKHDQSAELIGLSSIESRMNSLQESILETKNRVNIVRGSVAKLDDLAIVTTNENESEPRNVIAITSIDVQINNKRISDDLLLEFLASNNICENSPLLVASPKAQYEKIVWVLEALYTSGCEGIMIQDK